MERGTGITTRQMLAAPQGSIYIWCNSSLDYPRHLAAHLGRQDLQIYSPQWLEHGWVGYKFSSVILDHSCCLLETESDILKVLQQRVRR